ncbi:MAG: hypothetical protein M1365_08810 [Actinobacteria bacterium]|nr:hypothetical protein [Actinomycetota bacterium]
MSSMDSSRLIIFLLKELVHFILVGGISWFFYWKSRNWRLILAIVLSGIFIDIDHFFELFIYILMNPSRLSYEVMMSGEMISKTGKIYLLLHSWELIPILSFAGIVLERKLKIKGLMLAVVLSYSTHLLWDQVHLAHNPLAYFFTYRLLNNFSLSSFYGK